MHQLGVEMIPAYSPQARGRCERMFATHQERLPKELAARGIDTMHDANWYLAEHYRAAFNEEFAVPAAEPGCAFVPFEAGVGTRAAKSSSGCRSRAATGRNRPVPVGVRSRPDGARRAVRPEAGADGRPEASFIGAAASGSPPRRASAAGGSPARRRRPR